MQSMNSFLKSALDWIRHRATRSFILKLLIVLLVILLGSGIGVYYLEHDSSLVSVHWGGLVVDGGSYH